MKFDIPETRPFASARQEFDSGPAARVPQLRTPQPGHTPPEVRAPEKVFEIADFFDVDSAIYKSEAEPRTEFDFLLNKVLVLIKEMVLGHSVAFFWANFERGKWFWRRRFRQSALRQGGSLEMGHDLPSKVAPERQARACDRRESAFRRESIRY
jgi:hypothetical protein